MDKGFLIVYSVFFEVHLDANNALKVRLSSWRSWHEECHVYLALILSELLLTKCSRLGTGVNALVVLYNE